MPDDDTPLAQEIRECTLCKERFLATATRHSPRPIVWFNPGVRILVAGQAPGKRVHDSGIPFLDRSGDRLREWMGVDAEIFYDRNKIGILPTAFCFPGYDGKGSDLPPPPVCWETWHQRALQEIGDVPLTLIIGGYAIKRHLGLKAPMTQVVANWRDSAPGLFPLPHPSWRNTGWLKRNAWFEAELLPQLRSAVTSALG